VDIGTDIRNVRQNQFKEIRLSRHRLITSIALAGKFAIRVTKRGLGTSTAAFTV
jgi:hypothetical protein